MLYYSGRTARSPRTALMRGPMPLIRFQTYTSAARKKNMQRFGMFRSEATADLDVIDDASGSTIGFTGTQDGVNDTFTISAFPDKVYRNGLLQSSPADYSLVSNTIVWVNPPSEDDIILGFVE